MGLLAAASPFSGRAGATVLSSIVSGAPAPAAALPRSGTGVGPGPTPTSLRYHRVGAAAFRPNPGAQVLAAVPLDTAETVLDVQLIVPTSGISGTALFTADDGLGRSTVLATAPFSTPAGATTVVHLPVTGTVRADPEQFFYHVGIETTGPAATVAGAVVTTLRPTASLVLMDPVRVLDTRTAGSGGRLVGGETRGFTVDTIVPRIAVGPLLNVTLDQTAGSGYLVVFPGGEVHPVPPTSNINWYGDGQIVANLVVAPMAGEADLAVHAGGPGSTHVIVDVLGYFA
jgi:hypothetical protein